ncbi:MAG: hypothetical protein IKP40_12805 [Clostridia bacterium]|nr:hypothetical protein [Clostridia bacterium]
MKKVLLIVARILGALLVLVLLAALCVFLMYRHRSSPSDVKQYATSNPFITGGTQISAHRAGGGIMPEETMMALKNCTQDVDFTIDVFEFDLHMTRDGVLVLLHDDELDRTSDSIAVFGREHVRAEEMTYEELRRLNMGAQFVTDSGERPYAGLSGDEVPDDLRIVSLADALDYLEGIRSYYYIIEIKNGGELGCRGVDQLYRELKERGLLDRAVFGTFHGEVSDYKDETYPDLARGAYAREVVDFYLAAVTGRKDYNPPFTVLQLPFNLGRSSYYLNLGTARIINYAHAHNLAVQFWTVNNEEDMAYLLSISADCIMSDYPDRLYRVKMGAVSD